MSEEEKWIKRESKEIILYLAIGMLFMIVLPFAGGFLLHGFESAITPTGVHIDLSQYLSSYLVYFFFMVGALGLIIYPIGRLLQIDERDHPATQKHPSWFTIFSLSLIFSPEENGALYRLFHAVGLKGKRNPMRWSLSFFRWLMISIIIFGGLGILQISYPALNVSGVPHIAQQITTTSDIIFGSALPSFAENGLLCLIFFFLLGLDAYVCSRLFRGSENGLLAFFLIGFVIICPFMGLTWMQMHSIVYGNNDSSLIATFIFGWLGSTITLLFGVFIMWFIWHFMNNTFIRLGELISSKEDLFFIAIMIWILVLVLYLSGEYLLYRYKKWKRIKSPNVIIPE